MKSVIRFFGVALIIVGLAFMTGCASQTATPVKAKAAAATPDIKMGHYEDKALGFSLAYPAEVFSVENELEGTAVLFRQNAQQVPSLVIRVDAIPAGVALDKIGGWFLEDFKAANPESDRFKILESKMVKLKTGVDAHQTLLKWRYQGAVPVYTAVVSAYKNDKAIHALTTSVPGQPAAAVLMQMAMALKVQP